MTTPSNPQPQNQPLTYQPMQPDSQLSAPPSGNPGVSDAGVAQQPGSPQQPSSKTSKPLVVIVIILGIFIVAAIGVLMWMVLSDSSSTAKAAAPTPTSKQVTAAPKTVVPETKAKTPSAEPTPSQGEILAAKQQLNATLDSCLNDPHFVPAVCSQMYMEDPVVVAVTGIHRSWITRPTLNFVAESASSGYIVISGGDMLINYKYRYAAGETWEPDSTTRTQVYNDISVPVTFKPIQVNSNGLL